MQQTGATPTRRCRDTNRVDWDAPLTSGARWYAYYDAGRARTHNRVLEWHASSG
jgi:hypothetical protein